MISDASAELNEAELKDLLKPSATEQKVACRRNRMRTLLPLDNSLPHSEDRFDTTQSYARVQRGNFVGKPE